MKLSGSQRAGPGPGTGGARGRNGTGEGVAVAGDEVVRLEHGSGGAVTASFIEELLLPHLAADPSEGLADAAVVEVNAREIALSTNTFVVSPLEFPSANIGVLAVNGTINDLCTAGASPSHLSVSLVLEEGLGFDVVDRIAEGAGDAARRAGVSVVAGDVQVVERGRGDGMFVNTTGVGILDRDFRPSATRAEPGDAILVTGPMGRHALAVLAARDALGGVDLAGSPESDTVSLFPLLERLRNSAGPEIHALRDPTRGGLTAALDEIARSAGVGIDLDASRLPISPDVRRTCEELDVDPLDLCSAGIFVVVLPAPVADEVIPILRDHVLGREAELVGEVVEGHRGRIHVHHPGEGIRVLGPDFPEALQRVC